MAGGKGGAKVQVTEYYMSQHFGVCIEPDAFKSIIIKEKEAWRGYVTTRSFLRIQEDELFGGATKEGGATGTIFFLPGRSDQLLYDELAQRLGRANGADAPGYRGIGSVFFTGRPDVNKGARGFYWTANNPYLPGVWVEVERAPKGLTAAYAMIPRPGTETHPFSQVDDEGIGQYPLVGSPSGWLIQDSGGGEIPWWDLSTQTLIGVSPAPDIFAAANANVDLANDGTGYMYGQYFESLVSVIPALWTIPPAGTPSRVDITGPLNVGPTRVFDLDDGSRVIVGGVLAGDTGYVSGLAAVGDARTGRDFFLDSSNRVCGIFQPDSSSNSITVKALDGSFSFTFAGLVTRGAPNEPTGCHVPSQAHYFIVSDGKYYLVNDDTTGGSAGTIKDSGDFTLRTQNLPRKTPGDISYWSDFDLVSVEDATILETVDPLLWVNEDSGAGQVYYDAGHSAWISHPQFDAHLTWRFAGGILDANPAHIIYECLTNTDWGMGSPSTLIGVDSFEEAGVTLFNEPLGISLLWTRQASIQDFIQETLNHCNGVVFVDPQTGLLTMKLIRGDYVVDDLPTIDPSTAHLTGFGRKLWGDIPNEMNVTWTNPVNEQEETVTDQDLASITTQGGIVTDSRNYYGVRYADLAKRLAARELRSAGAPLASMSAEVDRSFYFLRPASVLRVDWPEYGLDGVVCRVASIDYGKPGDAAIKLTLVEDVFGLDAGDYVSPPSSSWEDTSQQPSAMDEQAALTLPFFFAANAIGGIDGATYPEVMAGVLGASDNPDANTYELWSEVAQPDGSTEWESLGTLNVVGYATLAADIDAEATSTGITFTGAVGSLTPELNGFAIFRGGDEAANEITLVTAIGATYSLKRGLLDTTPKAWVAGTPVWFVATDSIFEDPTTRSAGEVVSYRLRTRTSLGLLSLYAAPLLEYTLTERPWLPSRPANVAIGGVKFNDVSTPVDQIGVDPVNVSWANRNRLTEDSQVLGWEDATVTPETGQTSTVTILATDGTMLATHTALAGTDYDIAATDFGSEEIVEVRVGAARTDADGTFDSLQAHGIFVEVAAASPPANYWTEEALGDVAVDFGDPDATLISASHASPAGAYFGLWSCDVDCTDATETSATLKIDGATIEQQLLYNTDPVDSVPAGGMFLHTANGAAHTFALEGGNNTIGTSTFSNARVSLIPLGPNDATMEHLTTFNRSATSFGTAATLAFTPASDCVLLCSFNVTKTAADPTVQLSDGTTTIEYELTGTMKDGQLWMLPITGTGVTKNCTLKIKSNGAGQVGVQNIRMVALRKDRFGSVHTARITSDNSGTNSSYVDGSPALTQTWTPVAADHLVIPGIIGAADGKAAWKFDDGGTVVSEITRSPIRTNATDALCAIRSHRIAAYAASSRTQKVQRKAVGGGVTANIRAGSMIATFDLTGI